MSQTIEAPSTEIASPASAPRGRPWYREVLQWVRRFHLYLGLLLFPWAVLYGVTGLLFNHPSLLADSPVAHFDRADLAGTALEKIASPHDQATAVVEVLNARHKPTTPYTIPTNEARYSTRDSFVATVKADGRTFFVVYDPKTASGVIRETTKRVETEKAPFATASADAPRQRGMGMGVPMKHNHAGIAIEDSLVDRIKIAVPTVMERKGFPRGEVTVTTSPDIKFPIEADGRLWTATYNPLTTTVTGVPGAERTELSVRAFLLRLHLSRGYPGEVTTRWAWAVGVDAIAVVLCFWGVSGLFMWWQIKATRQVGLVLLAISAFAATALGFGMYALLVG